jgi:small subunit ribosomal protein S9
VSESENPQDEPRDEERQDAAEAPAESAPQPAAEQPEPAQPAAEQPEPPQPAAEQPEPAAEQPEPAAEQPEPAAEQPEPAEPAAEQPEPAAQPAAEQPELAQPAAEPPAPAQPAQPAAEQAERDEDEEIELAPRQRPEIPGADLVPDLLSEADEFMDAEARAAAEAEAELAAARAQQEEGDEEEARPIADAAIDLAAGARYTATGKRKTAVARVILKPGTGTYVINGKPFEAFFPRETLQRIIRQPLETVGYESRMDVVARMHGGGVAAQAGALRHGISRALLEADPNLRGELKRRGFLTRDPRVKERKKAGLKKARKRPQFSKR